jgi:hypothetical protein
LICQACGCEADLFDLGYIITFFVRLPPFPSSSFPLPLHPNSLLPQDLDTQDYLNDSPTLILNSQSIFDNALAGASSTTDEFLVISHDIHNQTSQVLVEYMLKGLLSKGYKPVTVGECLGDPKANWYRVDPSSTLG